jgi:hypothetical protein
VRARVEQLFADADQHGPRAVELVRRTIVALLVVLGAVALTASSSWRDAIYAAVGSGRVLDPLLVLPVILAMVVAGTLTAPLVRVPAVPLALVSAVLALTAVLFVGRGMLVVGTVPALLAALAAGTLAARAMRRAVWALPMLLAAGVSDARSVSNGITHALLEGAARAGGSAPHTLSAPVLRVPAAAVAQLDYVVIHVPVAHGTWLLGLVDIFAVAVLLGLTYTYWLPQRRTAVALGAVLLGAAALGTTIPMLPLLGAAWVAVHARLVWRSTRFTLRRFTYLGG